MIDLRAGALALLLCLGMVACTMRPPLHQLTKPAPPGLSPEAILMLSDRRWQLAEDLRALARTTILSVQGRYSTRQTVLWQRPASLRLETIGLFGQPSMTLIADSARAFIYYPQQGILYDGPATAATLARFIGLPLDAVEVVPLLMGYIRPSPAQRITTMLLQTDEGMHLLRFLRVAGELVQDVWVDPNALLPRRVIRYTTAGQPAVDISYSDYRPLQESFPFPHTLAIWLPGADTALRLQFLTVDLNPGLSPAVFHLIPPEGVPIIPLD
jgi:hypothetical protein